jgi:hypothetical protein
LTLFAAHTLASPFGAIQAVIYDGNEGVQGAINTTPITGFTVPAAPFTAMTTYVVADGQCGVAASNGCVGVPSGGSGDLARFIGSTGTFSNGPDAFKGSDGCPWGIDTCLWDTRTLDVSATLAPGDTSAMVEIESGPAVDSLDCINHETQIFAVGPTPAWALAGYKVDGVGLRNQGAGIVTIAGIPPGTQVVAAYLYWNILNATPPSGSMTINGAPAPGTMFKNGIDPCWNDGSWAFRANVTPHVAPTGGNGAYVLSGYPTGSILGNPPYGGLPSPEPMAEGASLAVLYEACPTQDDRDHDGLEDRDENLFHTLFDDPDSDYDGRKDGNEDSDDDDTDDEDEDDGPGECAKDDNDNGEDDEDEDDDDEGQDSDDDTGDSTDD